MHTVCKTLRHDHGGKKKSEATKPTADANLQVRNNLAPAGITFGQIDTHIHMYVYRCILCAKHCDMIMVEKQSQATVNDCLC